MPKVRKKETRIEGILFKHYESRENPGTHPVKVKVSHNRKTRYYPVQLDNQNIFLSPEQWRNPSKKIKQAIALTEAKAEEAKDIITHKGRPFSFDRFEKEFLQQDSEYGLLSLFERTLEELKADGRIGTYNSYSNAYASFKAFRNGKEIMPEDLTPELLKNFDAYIRKEKHIRTTTGKLVVRSGNKTTVGIYMRALKAVLNIAVSANPTLAEFYPFSKKQNDKGKYKIKTGSGHKGEALSIEDLQKFINTTPLETTQEWEAKLLWLFSFYAQGMNFTDILSLKFKDVYPDAIRYVRRKTQDTEDKEQVMDIPLSQPLKDIISKLGNSDRRPGAYVFRCLEHGMDPFREKIVIKQKIKITNKWLKTLCASNGLPSITTYWSRHSYASLLKSSGESVEMIKELLGHGDVKTTEAYLKRFELEKKQQVNEKIHALLERKNEETEEPGALG